ncbi:metal ABC transporter permease [Chitinispirillales bacterium ANBcel5]|uniref:metal ABC transporter permease n=1 Tax=Cellulosispirillum alkaliphilum TaxID=3039283 RepID=UPI002A56EF48|nr:metal ABC transporter permease [Chitinispirillales bacterium ANBcel5]
MSDFLFTFQFVLVPFFVLSVFATILPAVGSALYMRNEVMLAIALPPLTGAALTLGVALGLSPENHIALITFSFIVAFVVVSILGSIRVSRIKRQIILASLFAGGSVMTHLLMSISTQAHNHLSFLLTGELLSLGMWQLIQTAFLCLSVWVLLLFFKNAVFSYCIDEELMRLRTVHFSLFTILYRIIITVLISASVLFIGPLLTSALLIFPALLSDTGKSSISIFFLIAVVMGLTGSITGFIAGVAADIPPAYSASVAIVVLGMVLRTGVVGVGYVKGRRSQRP